MRPFQKKRRVQITDYPAEAVSIKLSGEGLRYTPATDVQALCWLARQIGGDILEVGCNEGITTRDLALSNPQRLVIGVDYCGPNDTLCAEQKREKPRRNALGRHARDCPNVCLLHIRSEELDYTQTYRAQAQARKKRSVSLATVRFIFIDGDHSYEGVRTDSIKAIKHLQRLRTQTGNGGIIVWHDYYESGPEWIGVNRYLTQELVARERIEHIQNTWLAVLRI